MAKASSPIRLQQDLMQQAELTAGRYHRSTAEQIEYWADLGRSVASTLDPDVLLAVSAGLSRLLVEPVIAPPVDPEAVFDSLESQRTTGSLARAVSENPVRYQASQKHPGALERLGPDGQIATGNFENGLFVVQSNTGS